MCKKVLAHNRTDSDTRRKTNVDNRSRERYFAIRVVGDSPIGRHGDLRVPEVDGDPTRRRDICYERRRSNYRTAGPTSERDTDTDDEKDGEDERGDGSTAVHRQAGAVVRVSSTLLVPGPRVAIRTPSEGTANKVRSPEYVRTTRIS